MRVAIFDLRRRRRTQRPCRPYPEKFAEKDIEVLTRHRVEKMEPENKRLAVRNLVTGEEFEDYYDRLVVSTGAKAVFPPIDGADLDGAFTLRFLTDTDAITRYMEEYSPERRRLRSSAGDSSASRSLRTSECSVWMSSS